MAHELTIELSLKRQKLYSSCLESRAIRFRPPRASQNCAAGWNRFSVLYLGGVVLVAAVAASQEGVFPALKQETSYSSSLISLVLKTM
ncbi:hypothetical protein D3C86_1957740 [compost metagenome]